MAGSRVRVFAYPMATTPSWLIAENEYLGVPNGDSTNLNRSRDRFSFLLVDEEDADVDAAVDVDVDDADAAEVSRASDEVLAVNVDVEALDVDVDSLLLLLLLADGARLDVLDDRGACGTSCHTHSSNSLEVAIQQPVAIE